MNQWVLNGHSGGQDMPLHCGENRFNGTANGYGIGLTRQQAEQAAIRDGNRNGTDTEDAIIRRVSQEECPDECKNLRFEDHSDPAGAQLLLGAAAPKQRFWVLWILIIPVAIPYWVAQAAYDWDLRWYCLREGEQPQPNIEA